MIYNFTWWMQHKPQNIITLVLYWNNRQSGWFILKTINNFSLIHMIFFLIPICSTSHINTDGSSVTATSHGGVRGSTVSHNFIFKLLPGQSFRYTFIYFIKSNILVLKAQTYTHTLTKASRKIILKIMIQLNHVNSN